MIKRLFDIVAGSIGLIVLSPLFIILALSVKISSTGPVFYKALRVGKDGKLFYVYKFRSMVADADKLGGGVTFAADPRVTPIGRVLRKYKLDELPQLINVVQGAMSFVGPRPEDPRYVELYTPEQRRVLELRPGITSLASVRYRHEEHLLSGDDWEKYYIGTVMQEKLRLDLYYFDHVSPYQDLKVIVRTLIALIH